MIFISVNILLVTLIGAISYIETSRTVRDEVVEISSQVMKQANMHLNQIHMDYDQFFLMVGTSPEFVSWLQYSKNQTYENYEAYKRIENNYILSFSARHPDLLSIVLADDLGKEMHYVKKFAIDSDYSIHSESWIRDLEPSNTFTLLARWNPNYIDGSGSPVTLPVITLVKKIYSGNKKGYMIADFTLARPRQLLSEIRIGETGHGMLIDQHGNYAVHPEPSYFLRSMDSRMKQRIVTQESGSFYNEDSGQIIIFDTVPSTRWKNVFVVPFEEVAQSLYRVRDMTVFIAAGGIGIAILLIVLVSSSITRRLYKLREALKKTPKGQFDQVMEVQGSDEVADVAIAYNKMLSSLNDTVDKLADAKSIQQEAVLSALQSQIDSHFLYNTLESINNMATLADVPEIEKATIALAKMFRYSSNYRNEVVQLRNEIDHLDNFMYITQIRFGSKVTYSKEVEPDILRLPCLKAVLQPLAENSIKHGIAVTGMPIHIMLRASRLSSTQLEIVLEDNGPGFDEDAFRELQHKMSIHSDERRFKKLSNVGLLNVNERIRMYYGSDRQAGLYIEQKVNRGARIRIVIPIPIEGEQHE
ncbi:histidine kinase [Paenibacillus sp. F411]|uniref:cache domain-containing sensor histidine kinase n=1 Tax=Paenibacillus sp. F411 TaxID=2820239 RepID=UPI001AAE4C69|nr:histidine kinase [Paenibacillus sp. F411]